MEPICGSSERRKAMKPEILIKDEIQSRRVKGLAFHPKRSWLLASLQSGVIQLWDYRMHALIENFEGHVGPVRGISFNYKQPLFVSGGDDYKVKVWNYRLRRCMFVLYGHLDYIRTVEFHHIYPWILSASDDLTIRIWNWQSRICLHILTAHEHYVMCAQFHPSEDLVVSASLDQTIRVWDISGLRRKSVDPKSNSLEEHLKNPYCYKSETANQPVIVKHVIEGHTRGVNWATFHNRLPIIVSGSDDRNIKLWRINETKAWEIASCSGHLNNVSCIVFHHNKPLFVSTSEDKTIRIWDQMKHTCIHKFQKEHVCYWVIAVHPTLNLFAVGHDNGTIIFKLERERPTFIVAKNTLFYIKHGFLRKLNFSTLKDVALIMLNGCPHDTAKTISYNRGQNAILISVRASNVEESYYELYKIPTQCLTIQRPTCCKKSIGRAALWNSENTFVVMDKNNILIKNIEDDLIEHIDIPKCDDICYAGSETLLLKHGNSILVFDWVQRNIVTEIKVNKCFNVTWSEDMKMLAILGKNDITMCTHYFTKLCSINEGHSIKSGSWDNKGVLIYATTNHIKYLIPNGDHGIIRSLDTPIYITKVVDNKLFAMGRNCKVSVLFIDPTEYKLKQALLNENTEEISNILTNSHLIGQSIISYLQEKGYPDLALKFVKDKETRFNLALDCCNICIAFEMAKEIDKTQVWEALSKVAIMAGELKVAETCYQRTKNFYKLVFLYCITGSLQKLRNITRVAEIHKNYTSHFQASLLLGHVEERISILSVCNQSTLAYVTAQTHGYNEAAKSLECKVSYTKISGIPKEPTFLKPPVPIMLSDSDWPVSPYTVM